LRGLQPTGDGIEASGITTHTFERGIIGAAWIDPVDRMLLTADGTVTTLLEACTGEPIATRATRQSGPATFDALLAATGPWWQPDVALLELAPAERLIARRAILQGAHSEVAYVLADSLIAIDRLPPFVGARLERAGASLGRLLAAGSLETRREILQITATRAGDAPGDLGVPPGAKLARRTHRIMTGARPAAVMTELLPPGRLSSMTTLGALDRGIDPPAS
jgi:chorismate--pyruvate lyase